MNVFSIQIPENSLATNALDNPDFQDSYSLNFKSDKDLKVEDIAFSFFQSSPSWVKKLFAFRNAIAKKLGLKVPDSKNRPKEIENFKLEPGNSIGLFLIYDKTENEILIGENDKHLDFRVAILLIELSSHQYQLIISTVAVLNNPLGRIYFSLVRHFHKIIVPAIMKNSIKKHL